MKTITKALVGTIAAGAMAMASSAPASAQSRYDYRDRHDGVSAGDVIAGAVVLGGIAAVAGSIGNGRGYNGYGYNGSYGYNGYNNGYGYNGYNMDPRQAVEQCIATATNQASRYSRGGRAQVTDIRNIDRTRSGYRISGRIAVNTGNRNWRGGWGNDYRGWNNNYNGYDAGRFTCRVDYGRVVDIDFSGIRGL